MFKLKGSVPWLAIAALIIIADQITKAVVTNYFVFGESLAVTPFFNLVLAYNTGAAFSFLAGAGGWQRWFFAGVAAAASFIIVYLLRKHSNEPRFCMALSLILGGALGNLIDRILLGHVVDFLDFYATGYHWPAFNVADSAITIGALILVWESLKGKPAPVPQPPPLHPQGACPSNPTRQEQPRGSTPQKGD